MPGYAPRLFTGGQLKSTYNCTVIVQTNGILALWPIRFYLTKNNVCDEDLTVLTHFEY